MTTDKRIQNYHRTSADMKRLVGQIVANAAHLLATQGSNFSDESIMTILDKQPVEQQIYAIGLASTHGAQARQSRFYAIRKLFVESPEQVPSYSYRSVELIPNMVNRILSCIFLRAEICSHEGAEYKSILRVFFGKAARPNAGKSTELFSLTEARGMELLGTGAKTEIVPVGSGGTPIAIAEPLFTGSPKTMSDEEIAAVLAASGNAAITDRLDTDFRSVFASDKE